MNNGHEDFNPLPQRIFWALAVAVVTAALLVFSGSGGLEALQSTIILVGLPFFIIAYFQIYALMRALREDAGVLPRVRMRRWKKVLPPEEVERRQGGDEQFGHEYDDDEEVVTEPEAGRTGTGVPGSVYRGIPREEEPAGGDLGQPHRQSFEELGPR
jgi:choline/glycine/proline betaine transport protein